jgi:cyclopropane fatty-acyl-phospholipid synthase-like methyltransferase
MSNPRWKRIWNDKRAALAAPARDEDAVLAELLALNGYDTPTGSVAPETWRRHIVEIATRHGLREGDRIFEVGCGAGAFLYPLARLGFVTDGIDYSESLVGAARHHLPRSRFSVGEAIDIDPDDKYELVVSCGVFFYFGDADYAMEVTRRMVEKSTRATWILDVNDADKEDEALSLRRASYPPGEYDRVYAGLQQLYLAKSWFRGFAADNDLACVIEPQSLDGYVSNHYRYNVYLTKR